VRDGLQIRRATVQRVCRFLAQVAPLILLGACVGVKPGYELPPAGRIELATATLDPLARMRAVVDNAERPSLNIADPIARAELNPTGTLRVAINYGNRQLASRSGLASTREPVGVSVDIARELARQLSAMVRWVEYDSAEQMLGGVRGGEWDIAFLALDPSREDLVDFSVAYLVIEGAILVPAASPLQRVEDIDRDGVRVVVGKGSIQDMVLARRLKRAQREHAVSAASVVETMLVSNAHAAAGSRAALAVEAKRRGGLRLLDGHFQRVLHAMAVPKGRLNAKQALDSFLANLTENGFGSFIGAALSRHQVDGIDVISPSTNR
jgi:polar amino acid transport system substrate-binding protein